MKIKSNVFEFEREVLLFITYVATDPPPPKKSDEPSSDIATAVVEMNMSPGLVLAYRILSPSTAF